jgi:hypothetical protein
MDECGLKVKWDGDSRAETRDGGKEMFFARGLQKNEPNTDGIFLTTTRKLKLRRRNSASKASSEPFGLSKSIRVTNPG